MKYKHLAIVINTTTDAPCRQLIPKMAMERELTLHLIARQDLNEVKAGAYLIVRMDGTDRHPVLEALGGDPRKGYGEVAGIYPADVELPSDVKLPPGASSMDEDVEDGKSKMKEAFEATWQSKKRRVVATPQSEKRNAEQAFPDSPDSRYPKKPRMAAQQSEKRNAEQAFPDSPDSRYPKKPRMAAQQSEKAPAEEAPASAGYAAALFAYWSPK